MKTLIEKISLLFCFKLSFLQFQLVKRSNKLWRSYASIVSGCKFINFKQWPKIIIVPKVFMRRISYWSLFIIYNLISKCRLPKNRVTKKNWTFRLQIIIISDEKFFSLPIIIIDEWNSISLAYKETRKILPA